MFYQWHLPPARLVKMYGNQSSNYWKCLKEQGTYYHAWWSCKKAQDFWHKIWMWLEEMMGLKINHKSNIFILGIMSEKYSKDDTYLIIHVITLARMTFVWKWKAREISREDEVIDKFLLSMVNV
uniref:Uncharacterized protein n=1 Tax=Laticauda laticaudata TaxID=8630 RepID=A0A8C5SZ19_LATLA